MASLARRAVFRELAPSVRETAPTLLSATILIDSAMRTENALNSSASTANISCRHDRYLLHFAFEYFDRGWSVIPLDGKRPALKRWKEFQSRRPTLAELRDWFADPAVNIGIVTGSVSGGLLVVDCDTPEDAAWWTATHPRSPLVVHTGGGGNHIYYRLSPATSVGNRSKVCSRSIDIRGTGGYVVAPPSQHPMTGTLYAWADDGAYSWDDIPLFDSTWLVGDTQAPSESHVRLPHSSPEFAGQEIGRNERTGKRIRKLVRCLDLDVADRSRRDYAIVCELLRLGVTPEEIWQLVQQRSKFQSAGRSYFNVTIKNALRAVNG